MLESVYLEHYSSPAGELILGSRRDRMCLCDWVSANTSSKFVNTESEVTQRAVAQLKEYFEGKREAFTIPLEPVGTEFQCRVWAELMKIPYGKTVSYGEIARKIGMPKAVRAVASAIAANHMSIFIPCHRVIGSNGRLTGYRGGLAAKQTLLTIEGITSSILNP
ncbi:MAG: methylated-DNA--[protein]-cysteine S-methyltransferase [Bacteroides sp.]|nr:methylated-DNA--[protein]-cysteine S-methyltransferase [Bacteroides sp.]MCM1379041.1 methylated-DNA--[protein]-cysteine S-methyltransferase [Bacteroides sp.]MCM1445657.1 methylated-DNA--[protein]-cysteine S-methyltransferase [Prevotella sp.]